MATLRQIGLRWLGMAVSTLCVTNVALLAQAQSANAQEALLLRGQVLELRLVRPLDSARNNVGDKVELQLVKALQAGGMTILKADSMVEGRVTKVVRAWKCKEGQLEWKLLTIKLPDHTKIKLLARAYENSLDGVRLDSTWTRVGTALTYAFMVITAAPFIAVELPIALVHAIAVTGRRNRNGCDGRDVEIPADTIFYTVVSKSVRVREPKSSVIP